jgi:selenocysteine lyase/cysteine desulfurase
LNPSVSAGSRTSIAPYVLATGGIETSADIGIDAIFAHNRQWIQVFAEAAEVEIDMTARGGTMGLTADGIDVVAATLDARGCRFDRRARIIRLSPHIYNGLEEARELGSALRGENLALI